MDNLIKTTRGSSKNNKNQRGDLFQTNENKGKQREYLKSLIYFDRSLRGDPKKDRLIDELNFENCVRLNRKTASKLFVVITMKKIYYSS